MNRRLQLEMPLEPTAGFRRGRIQRRRMTRARWWFSQMRLAVEQASDWEPDPVRTPVELGDANGRMNVS